MHLKSKTIHGEFGPCASITLFFLCKGRILTGIFGSCLIANCPMLVAQYSSVNRRGPFLSAYPLMFSIGKFISTGCLKLTVFF